MHRSIQIWSQGKNKALVFATGLSPQLVGFISAKKGFKTIR